MNITAALATTTTILSASAFCGAIGVTVALCNKDLKAKVALAWIAALVVAGAVFAGAGVGFSH